MAAITFEDLAGQVGQELGVSDWLQIDQSRINEFAECTEDRQWIHVDPERAAKESPFRTTIAHGYLTLSLVAGLSMQVIKMPSNLMAAVNYGLDKVRFLAPVKVGAKVRLRVQLAALDEKGPGQFLMKATNTLEIDGEDKPALIADTLAMLYVRPGK